MDTVTVALVNNGVQFRAHGSVVKFPGFMKVYVESNDDGVEEKKIVYFPRLKLVKRYFSKDIEPKQHFTQPPPRYTEARLVKKTLEELGIGRPSTYVPTLETIQKNAATWHLKINALYLRSLGRLSLNSSLNFFPRHYQY
ncbi:hypothetical protein GCM10020331_047950 [Ectobacillus funiculus]